MFHCYITSGLTAKTDSSFSKKVGSAILMSDNSFKFDGNTV